MEQDDPAGGEQRQGVNADQGVYLVPNVPLVFAFPPNPTPMFIWSGAAELCDVMFI